MFQSEIWKGECSNIITGVEWFLGNDRKQTSSRGNSPRSAVELLLETVFSTVVRAEKL
jgi:hypothetical protein